MTKQKVFVFDGMPCTGKSTILKKLNIPNKYYDNGKVRHKNVFDKPYADEILIERIYTLIEFISMTNLDKVLIDRLTASEYVFGSLIRNYNTECIFDIEKQLTELVDLHVILFIDDVENIQKRMLERDGKLRYNDDYMLLVQKMFMNWHIHTTVQTHIINVNEHKDWDEIYYNVKKYIEKS